jgi:hypothetical protein
MLNYAAFCLIKMMEDERWKMDLKMENQNDFQIENEF